MSETALVRAILQALDARGYMAWRVNSGALVVGEGSGRRFFRGAPPGTPDIFVLVNGGRLVSLEVKTATGKQRPSQATWQARAESLGGIYAIVRSVRDALEVMARI